MDEAERCVCPSKIWGNKPFFNRKRNVDNVHDQMLAQGCREAVQSLSLEIFTIWVDTALHKLLWQHLLCTRSCVIPPPGVPPRETAVAGRQVRPLLVSYTHLCKAKEYMVLLHAPLSSHFLPTSALLFPLQPCVCYFISFCWTLFISSQSLILLSLESSSPNSTLLLQSHFSLPDVLTTKWSQAQA